MCFGELVLGSERVLEEGERDRIDLIVWRD